MYKMYRSTITRVRDEVCEPPVAENTLCNSTVADHNDSSDEENDAEQTWATLQQEGEQVQHYYQHLLLQDEGTV